MVDELMLQDVKSILKKIELIRAKENFKQILIDNGLTRATEVEIDEFIVSTYMSTDEVSLYKRYMLYKKREDLANRSKKKSETNCDIFITS